MALGSTSNDFNTPGVKENCIFLDNPHQARRFHQEMLNLFRNTPPTWARMAK